MNFFRLWLIRQNTSGKKATNLVILNAPKKNIIPQTSTFMCDPTLPIFLTFAYTKTIRIRGDATLLPRILFFISRELSTVGPIILSHTDGRTWRSLIGWRRAKFDCKLGQRCQQFSNGCFGVQNLLTYHQYRSFIPQHYQLWLMFSVFEI